MRIVLAAAALACASGAWARGTRSFPAAGISALKVETEAGNVEVTAGVGDVEVEATHVDAGRCRLTMEAKDGTVVLKAETRSRTGMLRRGCEAGFKVTVPAATRVAVETGAGNVTASGIAGAATLSTGAGRIDGSLASSDASAYAGAGSIRLSWTERPAAGRITAETGAGSIEVALPADTRIEADLSTGVGSLRNELGDTRGAPLRVRASSGVGRVAVVKS